MTGGVALYYRLGKREPIHDLDGRWLRDTAGRTALEAFGALPVGKIQRRLKQLEETWAALDAADRASLLDAEPDRLQRLALEALEEVVALVRMFGPFGFAWPRTFEVSNPVADRALGPAEPRRRWEVVMPSPGIASARVSELYSERESPWADRVAVGDGALRPDLIWGPRGLEGHRDDLWRALRLVQVLGEEAPNPFAIRNAAGDLPRAQGYDIRDHGPRDPVDARWAEAMRLPPSARRGWSPFDVHSTSVDWVVAGKLMLAEYLTGQLASSRTGVGLDQSGRLRTRWIPGSLLEIIYLQLLEHVEHRLSFGVGTCERCGGPILRTRMAAGTRNRSHRGCAPVIRKRRQRERERLAAQGPS
jgi:hypothetical protein